MDESDSPRFKMNRASVEGAPLFLRSDQSVVLKTTPKRQIKAAGGQWNRRDKVWNLRYDQAVAFDVVDRIVETAL